MKQLQKQAADISDEMLELAGRTEVLLAHCMDTEPDLLSVSIRYVLKRYENLSERLRKITVELDLLPDGELSELQRDSCRMTRALLGQNETVIRKNMDSLEQILEAIRARQLAGKQELVAGELERIRVLKRRLGED